MKKMIFILTIFLMISSLSFAETIYLKSGRTIKGKIIEKAEDQIKIDANGITLTYYADEIDRIEGEGVSKTIAPQTPSASPSLIEQPTSPKISDTPESASTDKKGLILKYLEVRGVKANIQKTFDDIINAATPDKKANLRQALNVDDIVNQLIPVYDQYFTVQDLKDLIVFYESPVAKKLFKVEPLFLKDSIEKVRQYLEGKIK